MLPEPGPAWLPQFQPAREGMSEGLHPLCACSGSIQGGLLPAPQGHAQTGSVREMRQKERGDVVTKVWGKDQRHTLDLQVPNPIHRPPAVSAATEDVRAGDTVHLERGTRASPWLGGGGQSLLRWS